MWSGRSGWKLQAEQVSLIEQGELRVLRMLAAILTEASATLQAGWGIPKVLRELSRKVKDGRAASCNMANKSLWDILEASVSDSSYKMTEELVITNVEDFVLEAKQALAKKQEEAARSSAGKISQKLETELCAQKRQKWKVVKGCGARCPGCGTKCNEADPNHYEDNGVPHSCRVHLLPAFTGWTNREDWTPVLTHCRSVKGWKRKIVDNGEWDNTLQYMQEQHPSWLDASGQPLTSMRPDTGFDDVPEAGKQSQAQKEELDMLRRAWVGLRDVLYEQQGPRWASTECPWEAAFREHPSFSPLPVADMEQLKEELFEVGQP